MAKAKIKLDTKLQFGDYDETQAEFDLRMSFINGYIEGKSGKPHFNLVEYHSDPRGYFWKKYSGKK
jgi:hypothetical protein